MRTYTLDGKKIKSEEDFYDQLVHKLGLSSQFGRNMDALWDTLTTDFAGPCKLIWKSAASTEKAMPEKYKMFADLLRAVSEERDDFLVHFK